MKKRTRTLFNTEVLKFYLFCQKDINRLYCHFFSVYKFCNNLLDQLVKKSIANYNLYLSLY